MLMIIGLIYALLGLIIGSFLNVVILRHGARTVGGRSGCLSCGAPLVWYDMIPVLSWVILRGRCRSCGSAISVQYPLVEATTAILFGVIGAAGLSLPLTAVALIIVALLVLIATYDLRHTIIPDEWAYAFAVLAFIASSPAALSYGGAGGLILLIVAGPATALPIFALWAVSRGQWMGLGDAKLALGIGFLLGIGDGLTAIFLAFVLGAVISLAMLSFVRLRRHAGAHRRGHSLTMKSEVPFGPFLVAGCVVLWIMSIYGIPVPAFII